MHLDLGEQQFVPMSDLLTALALYSCCLSTTRSPAATTLTAAGSLRTLRLRPTILLE
jgi:hypothetical protein